MGIFNNKLDRKKLVDKIEYQKSGKRAKYTNINDFILEEISIIKSEISKKVCDPNENIVLSDRQAWCKEEFDRYIEENKLEQAFYDLYEFIDSYISCLSIREKERGYQYLKVITKYEVDVIKYMIIKLEEKIVK